MPHDAETETVVITTSDDDAAVTQPEAQRERRFTAPGFDAKETQVIVTAHEAATEVFQTNQAPTTPPRMPTGMPRKLLCHNQSRHGRRRRQSGNAPGAGRWRW